MHDTLKQVKINDDFFNKYEKLIAETVLPYQEKILRDQIEDAEKSHAIANFEAAAETLKTGKVPEDFYGFVFQDSDVAKWLEGAAYSLLNKPDPELEKRADSVIELIASAQMPDGYLDTYFTLKPDCPRWSNLGEAHELYCAGHMIEAAVAYYECTGKTRFLEIMCRVADHIYNHFITEKAEGYPGHPEVELALMRLYRATGKPEYLELAKHFVDVRGVDSDYFIKEKLRRGWTVWGSDHLNKEYAQNHKPVREQDKATGHSVRAAYLYTGMADVAATTNDKELADACRRLWDNMTRKRMYITGSIGSAYEGESFTEDYHLPNDTTYGETCAAIALVFFGRKMIDLEKNGKYGDAMEKALYNGILSGMHLDGMHFFYVNPLEVIPGISGKAQTHKHTLPQRPKWFPCACCPPNIARLLPSIGRYAWAEETDSPKGHTVWSTLFVGSTIQLQDNKGKIRLDTGKTGYPYGGKLTYTFECAEGNKNVDATLAVRLPEWSRKTVIQINGKPAEYKEETGYAYISGPFDSSTEITVEFDMSVRFLYARTEVASNSGKAAVMRGPVVYCAEGVDNNGTVLGLCIDTSASVDEKTVADPVLGKIVVLDAKGNAIKQEEDAPLYSDRKPVAENCNIRLIPYYSWGNRGLTQMRVWIPYVNIK